MSTKRTPSDTESDLAKARNELTILRRTRTADAITSICNNLIQWTALVAIFYISYLSVNVLAGKTTFADIGIKMSLLGKITISQTLAWAFAFGGIGYGWRQKKLRRDVIETQGDHIKKLESGTDKKRTSSNLTRRGETSPEDKK